MTLVQVAGVLEGGLASSRSLRREATFASRLAEVVPVAEGLQIGRVVVAAGCDVVHVGRVHAAAAPGVLADMLAVVSVADEDGEADRGPVGGKFLLAGAARPTRHR